MKTCPNEKCPGPVIYQGTSCVNGAFIEWYECRGCWTLHKVEAQPAPLLTGDEDTEPIAVIVAEVSE